LGPHPAEAWTQREIAVGGTTLRIIEQGSGPLVLPWCPSAPAAA
jgi:hypothetical protein